MDKVYQIECEWDMGFSHKIYSSKVVAKQAIRDTDWSQILENGQTVEDLMADGLLTIKTLDFITDH